MSETSSSATPLSARDAIAQHVNNTTVVSEALESARESAREYGVAVPDTMTGAALTSLMALTSARRDGHPAAVIASPAAGIRPNRQRFLPSQPLEVMDRLAADSYDLVYLDVAPAILRAAQEKAWPLLRSGGALVLTGALLDGTVADSSRTDRDTVAAREADEYMLQLDDAYVMRLPLAAGTTVLVKK